MCVSRSGPFNAFRLLIGTWVGMCAVAFLIPASARAQSASTSPPPAPLSSQLSELSLEQLMAVPVEFVSTASKFSQKIAEAPSSVSVVTSEDIKVYGYRTIAEILQSLNGVYITSDRDYSYLGLRGFNRPGDFNSRVLVLVDGHRVNDPIFGSPLLTQGIDVDLIDRVELVRGPSSSLYGDNAFLGVVNIITKKPEDLRHGEASVELGSYETYKGRFSYGGVFTNTGVGLLLSGSWYDSAGKQDIFFPEFNSPADHNGIAHDLDWEHAQSLLGKLSWKDLSLEGSFVNREKGVPTAAYQTKFNDPRFKTIDQSGFAEFKYKHRFEENDSTIMTRLYYDRYHYDGFYPALRGLPEPPVVVNRDHDTGESAGWEIQYMREWERNTITAGLEVRDDFNLYMENFDESPAFTWQRERRDDVIVGVYAQDQITIRTNLLLNVGARYDHYDTFGSTVNPRAGLIYSPWESTTFKAIYGTAFRSPNAYELYLNSDVEKGNPNLDPEKINTYELIAEQKLTRHLQASVSGYYYQINDLINQVVENQGGNEIQVFQNVEQVQALGLETELVGRFDHGIVARASYAIQRASDTETGATLSNSPRHLAKLNLRSPLYSDRLFTGLELQYTGTSKTLLGRDTGDWWILNWNLFSQNIVKGLEVSAGIYNLLDTHYYFAGRPEHVEDLLAQDGRTFRVKLTYHF